MAVAALTFTAAAAPAALAGVRSAGNSNGVNSAAWTYAGSTPGIGDTIANAELLKGVSTRSRLYTFLTTAFADQAALDAYAAALGLNISVNGGSLFYLVTAGAAVPTATMTTVAGDGMVKLSIAHSLDR